MPRRQRQQVEDAELRAVLDRLTDVPVDIEPRFVTAAQLLSGS